VIPYVNGNLIHGSSEILDEQPGLAAWWRDAERTWENNKARDSRLSLLDRIDYHRGLSRQLPIAAQRIVYTTSGQYLAACRLEDPTVLVDSSLYWAPVASVAEARYLTGVLNSKTVADAVKPLQARGEHNPRHFHLLPFEMPFPLFDANDERHRAIVDLAERAEIVSAGVLLDPSVRFETGRRAVRDALAVDGVATDLAAAVARLLDSPEAG
jgi:hypothetical protein